MPRFVWFCHQWSYLRLWVVHTSSHRPPLCTKNVGGLPSFVPPPSTHPSGFGLLVLVSSSCTRDAPLLARSHTHYHALKTDDKTHVYVPILQNCLIRPKEGEKESPPIPHRQRASCFPPSLCLCGCGPLLPPLWCLSLPGQTASPRSSIHPTIIITTAAATANHHHQPTPSLPTCPQFPHFPRGMDHIHALKCPETCNKLIKTSTPEK